MVWMGITCILQTNTFLVARYWNFNFFFKVARCLVFVKALAGLLSHIQYFLMLKSKKISNWLN